VGTIRTATATIRGVDCQTCRHALSARLDGEDQPAERAATDTHLDACPDCRRWYDDAARLARLVTGGVMSGPAPPGAVDDVVLDSAPGPWRARLAQALRWTLAGLGAAQIVLGVTQITALAARTHVHADQLASAGHLWHESAAWNLAVGAGFAWIAARQARPAGLLPVLTVFVTLLALLSLNDVASGRVHAGWLLSHGFLLAGYIVLVLLTGPHLDFGDPPANRGTRRWTVERQDLRDPDALPEASAARRRTPHTPAARRDVAA
jgi:predicted anti-sigma-YlaC factor YlaD